MKDTIRHCVIPAAPGWFVLQPIRGDDNVTREFFYEPVIAWAIEQGALLSDPDSVWTHIDPVTIQGNDDNAILRRPDGTYAMAQEADFETEQEVMEYINKNRRHD